MTSRRRFLAVAGATATGLGVAAYSRRGESLFTFGDGVSSTVRERCQRVEGRYPDLIDRVPTDPVRIEMESDRPSRSGFDSESRASRIRFGARHFTPADIDVPPAAGYYDDARRSIYLVDDPDEPLIAHELTHAVQYDFLEAQNVRDEYFDADNDPEQRTSKGRSAVIEGMATYVQSRYGNRCLSDQYDPCVMPAAEPPVEHPLFLLSEQGHAYVTGAQFVRIVREVRGWDAVWDSYLSPPVTMHSVMFPGRYLDDPIDPVDVEVTHEPPADWFDFHAETGGVVGLYAKLFALDIVSPQLPESGPDRVATAMQDGVTLQSDLLRGWRGDRLVGYSHIDDPQRLAYRWNTQWATRDDAADVADAVASGYDDQGRQDGAGWYLHDQFHGIERDGTTVVFTMAPTREQHADVFKTDNGS
jgi:hypothetical protein